MCCYSCLSITPAWLVIPTKKKKAEPAVNQSSQLNPCGFQVPVCPGCSYLCRLHWWWRAQPGLSLQQENESTKGNLNPLKSTYQRHWKGWRRALYDGRRRVCWHFKGTTRIIWNQICGLLVVCSCDLTHVHYIWSYRKWCSNRFKRNWREFLMICVNLENSR